MNGLELLDGLWDKATVPVFLERFVLPILAALVVLLAVTNPMRWGWTPRIIGSLGVLIGAYCTSRALHRQQHRKPTPHPLPNDPTRSSDRGDQSKGAVTAEPPVHIDTQPEELIEFFRRHTHVQAEKLVAPFLHKWITVSGNLDEVLDDADFGHVAAMIKRTIESKGEEITINVWMRFPRSWLDQLAMLKRGDPITVSGQLAFVNAGKVQLERCQLVRRG